MGWFDEQIRQRTESDQAILMDAVSRMAGAVMDRWRMEGTAPAHLAARASLDAILRYYHCRPADIPDDIADPGEQLAWALKPAGLMTRQVLLDEGWHRAAYGPMLGCLRESGITVALIPGKVSGYSYRDPRTGRRVRISRKTEALFSRDAISFYQPLPLKPLERRDLVRYIRDSVSHGDLLLTVLASLALVLVSLLEPRLLRLITGPVLQEGRMSLLGSACAFLFCAMLAASLISAVRSLLMARVRTRAARSVEASLMMRVLLLPVSFFRRFSTGELLSRVNAGHSLCVLLLDSVLSTGLSCLMSLIFLAEIAAIAPPLTAATGLIVLASALLSLAACTVQAGVARRKMRLGARETGIAYGILSGIEKIRLTGAEKRMFARWGRVYASKARLTYHPPAFLRVSGVLQLAISLFGLVLLRDLAAHSGLDPSRYFAFSAAYGQLMGTFSLLGSAALSAASIRPLLEMVEPVLQAEPETAPDRESVTQITGDVEMSHVSFRYAEGGPEVLSDLSLSIRAGEYTAIVGSTGSGKSTLVRLLLGFEKPDKGAVFYGRYDLAAVDPRSVRRHIGVVMQNGQLFQGDILSNITISAPHCTLAEAWQAAETAGIARDIREMPMGMHTVITQGQGGISGGQKQRLLIARAIAAKPKLLILDEATSALDNLTQRQVAEALGRLHCTRIVIAHRLSTVKQCDRILVMEGGRIVEEGNYQQLMAQGGVFAGLVARQQLDEPQAEA